MNALEDAICVTLSSGTVIKIDTTMSEVAHFWRRYQYLRSRYPDCTSPAFQNRTDHFLHMLSLFGEWLDTHRGYSEWDLAYQQAQLGRALDAIEEVAKISLQLTS